MEGGITSSCIRIGFEKQMRISSRGDLQGAGKKGKARQGYGSVFSGR
jgi:hypothetical protein